MVYTRPEDTEARFVELLKKSGVSHQTMAYLLRHTARLSLLAQSITPCEPIRPIALGDALDDKRLVIVLMSRGHTWLHQLAYLEPKDLVGIPRYSESIQEIQVALERRGWHFGTKRPEPSKKK